MREKYYVIVLGKMSSGKSTFINTFLSKDLMPRSNLSCTETMVEMCHTNSTKYSCKLSGSKIIMNDIDRKTMLELFRKKITTDKIVVNGRVAGFEKIEKDIVLVDTPGLNNAISMNDRITVFKYLKDIGKGTIVYILNASDICTFDDQCVLKELKKFADYGDFKIIFVVNKCDRLSEEEKKNVPENTKKFLQNEGFSSPEIFMISAEYELLLQKKIRKDTLTEFEEEELEWWLKSIKTSSIECLKENTWKKIVLKLKPYINKKYKNIVVGGKRYFVEDLMMSKNTQTIKQMREQISFYAER